LWQQRSLAGRKKYSEHCMEFSLSDLSLQRYRQ
jgi:hypothetical protein